MGRCSPHRMIEPCFYCQHGMQPFSSTAVHLDALEERLRRWGQSVNPAEQQVGISETPASPAGLDISQAVAVVRDYALGDLVMLSAGLQALKQKDPTRPLVLVTRPELYDILAGADYLDAQLPKNHYEHANFYRVIDLCGAVETEAGGKLAVKKYLTQTRPDLFAELLGVEGGAEKFPVPVNPASLSKMQTVLGGCKRPLIGVAPTCNSPVRVMPPEYVEPLVKKILKSHGGTVVLLGKTAVWNRELANLKMPNVVNLIDTLDVKELIAACSLMSAMISPDTGTMHVAGALEVKCLALMGNNNPKNFAGFYPSVKVLQPTAKELPCVPCNDRSIPCTPLPPGQYGAECMRLMTPDKIHTAFKSFYNGKNIAYLHDTSLTYVGGAEITTKQMIQVGREAGYNIRLFDRGTPVEDFYSLYGYDLVILSNVWRFSDAAMAIIMQVIRTVPYVKYEHDHDGLGEKALGKWPMDDYAKKIYRGSVLNIFVSPAHKADYAALGDGICIPELIDVAMFKPVPGVERQAKSVLVAVPGKWDPEVLKAYIKKNPTLKIDVLDRKVPHADMPALYSQYESLAHFPQRKWPCDRVIYEAALCGCKVEAGDIVEALSWAMDLTDTKGLSKWLQEVPRQFWGEIANVLEGAKHG
jgi:ADP-heptose:LPS heptosyltransferase